MRNFGHCERHTRSPRIVLEERRSKICFLNPLRNAVRCVKIDDCVLTEGPRCDHLILGGDAVILGDGPVEQYVELKGADVRRALIQITTTIGKISEAPRTSRKKAYVVSTRCPLSSPEIQAQQKHFLKSHNAVLRVCRSGTEVSI